MWAEIIIGLAIIGAGALLIHLEYSLAIRVLTQHRSKRNLILGVHWFAMVNTLLGAILLISKVVGSSPARGPLIATSSVLLAAFVMYFELPRLAKAEKRLGTAPAKLIVIKPIAFIIFALISAGFFAFAMFWRFRIAR